MKFYSEVTGKIYDCVEELKNAEAAENKKREMGGLIEEIADLQIQIIDLGKRIVEITHKDFITPSVKIFPDDSFESSIGEKKANFEALPKNEEDVSDETVLETDSGTSDEENNEDAETDRTNSTFSFDF